MSGHSLECKTEKRQREKERGKISRIDFFLGKQYVGRKKKARRRNQYLHQTNKTQFLNPKERERPQMSPNEPKTSEVKTQFSRPKSMQTIFFSAKIDRNQFLW